MKVEKYLFPETGFEDESGAEPGDGYSVNVPLHPYADDELFTWAFHQVVPPSLSAFVPARYSGQTTRGGLILERSPLRSQTHHRGIRRHG
jgi:Histone deacetylase domain